MTDRDAGGYRSGELLEAHREAARSLLEDIIEAADPGGAMPFRSTEFGPSDGELGFNYRNGSLMVEYRTEVNAAEGHPDTAAAASELMELNDHTPLPAAGRPYDAVESTALELVAATVAAAPVTEALEPVTVWPVTSDPGLYRVGYETQENEFLYAVAFKIPSDAMQ